MTTPHANSSPEHNSGLAPHKPQRNSRPVSRATPRSAGPFFGILNLFSSVWLGITLLFLLFIYSSIGSAGAPIGLNILNPENWVAVRQMRAFELTEFEWFHWWPFDLLIGLICINVTVATLRRIPFNKLNLGVWMIHTGILTLCAGSVWYFSTKLEGDTPVARRRIVAVLSDGDTASMLAKPGNQITLGTGDQLYNLQISNIDPTWELLSGDDKGKKAYAVKVRVTTAARTFTRQLLAGYPQYTEDVVRNPDAQPGEPPMTRARKINPDGNPLVDDTLSLALEYEPQSNFYLMDSSAIYLRKRGETKWVQRPIEGLPQYNDYLAHPDDAVNPGSEITTPLCKITLAPTESDDSLAVDLSITGYLRYASMTSALVPHGPALNPAVTIRIGTPDGRTEEGRLLAFDPVQSVVGGGRLRFQWFSSEQELEAYIRTEPALLHITVPEHDLDLEIPITEMLAANPDLEFTPLEGTDYAWRVQNMSDDLMIEGGVFSLAIVEIRKGENTWTRWVFDNPDLSRDLPDENALGGHNSPRIIHEGITMEYVKGKYPAPITIAAGPDPSTLRLIRTFGTESGEPQITPLSIGPQSPADLTAGMTLTILDYLPRAQTETKPVIVPRSQRERDMRRMASMIQVTIPGLVGSQAVWLAYHDYAFASEDEALLRFPHQPTEVLIQDGSADGTVYELLFSRRRVPLPAPVALDDFLITSHIGGFTGQASSIRNWTSVVRFLDGDAGDSETWGEHREVSVNEPTEYRGFWFYQAQWDPPFSSEGFSSAGLNYTVLGVGNRNGVVVQLAGCCIAVLGMIYAFYIKPGIKRRRQQEVYARVAATRAQEATPNPDETAEPLVPVGIGVEDQP